MTIEYKDSKRIVGLSDGVSSGYDVANISYSGKSSSSSSQNTYMLGIGFNADGTKMYRTGYSSTRAIFQYTLSTAWDISTASYDSVSFSLPSPIAVPYGIEWNGDGTKFVVGDSSTGDLYQFSLTTAYDISTTNSTPTTYDSSQATKPVAIKFTNSGTKVFVLNNQNDTVYRYSLSTAYDITTMSYDSNSFTMADYYPTGLELNSDGTEMYIQDHVGNSLRRFTLSTAYDLSTASLTSSFSTSSQFSSQTSSSLRFSADGTKLYISGYGASDFQYDTGSTASDRTLLTNVQDNSLFVEKDTARRYWFDAESERTPTFEDDFSSDNWTDVGTQIGVSGGKMVWNALRSGSNQGSYYDIGTANISETEWVLDFTLDIDAMTEGDTNAYFTIGLSDTSTMNVNTSQDFIGLLTFLSTSSANNSRFMATGANGGTTVGGTDFTTSDPQTLGLFYVRIRRTSATECKVAIYSNSDYSTLVEEQTVTITSGLTGLRYLKLTNLTVSGAGTGVFNGTMDNVKYYNSTTSTITPATWINEFGVSDGLMFGGVSTSSYANFSDSQSWNGVSWTAGGSLTGARQRGASAGTGSTSARYVNGYNDSPAPYPNSNRNESYNGTSWTSDTVHPQSVNNKGDGGCGTVDSMIVTGGHKNGTGDVNNYYKWTGSWTSIAQGITGSGGSISGTLTSALMTKSTSAQTWNGSSWTSSTATSTSRTFSPASGTSSTSGFRVFGTYANPFISTSESWNGTAWTARGSAPAGRVEAGCIPASTDSMMTLGGMQYHGASGSDLYSTDVYEYRKGTFTTGASFSNGRRSCGGAGS